MTETTPETKDNADLAPAGQDNAAKTTPEAAATPKPAEAKAEPAKTGNDWLDSLPEDVRGNSSLGKFSSTEALAKSYLNLERTLGSDKLPVPKSEDDAEGWGKVYKALGRPDEPGGYEFKKLDLPEGFAYNTEREAGFRGVAHKLGLSTRQAQELRDWTLSEMAKDFGDIGADTEAAMLATIQTLQKEWGNAAPQKIDAAYKTTTALFGEEFQTMLNETGLGNDIRLIRGMASLAEKVGGDKGIIGDALQAHTPADLDAKIRDFRAQYAAVLNDKFHPDHGARTTALTQLYEQRYPEGAA